MIPSDDLGHPHEVASMGPPLKAAENILRVESGYEWVTLLQWGRR